MTNPMICINLSAIISEYKSFEEAVSTEEIQKIYALKHKTWYDIDTIEAQVCELIKINCGYKCKNFKVWYEPVVSAVEPFAA